MTHEVPIEVDCRTVQQRIAAGEPFVLLDCREPAEYQIAKIEQARLLPMSEISQRFKELAGLEETNVVVHCHHGGRSLRVAEWLREYGFPKAQSMAGGIDAWSQEIDSSVPRY